MKSWLRSTLLVCAGSCAFVVSTASAVPAAQPQRATSVSYGANLIVNGDAEAGVGSDGGIVPVPSWTTLIGDFTVVQYGASGVPDLTAPGPANRGKNLFTGGPDGAMAQATQTIDVSALAADIDTGTISYTLSGYFGGYASQDDNAFVYVSLKSGATSLDVSPNVGAVTPAERMNATELLARSYTGVIPAGTRSIEVDLVQLRLQGSANDGDADNLSLVLSNGKPTPRVFVPLASRGA